MNEEIEEYLKDNLEEVESLLNTTDLRKKVKIKIIYKIEIFYFLIIFFTKSSNFSEKQLHDMLYNFEFLFKEFKDYIENEIKKHDIEIFFGYIEQSVNKLISYHNIDEHDFNIYYNNILRKRKINSIFNEDL